MNKLERITAIVILSSIPYITNAQSSKSEEIPNSKHNMETIILARLDSRRNEEYNITELPASTPKEIINKSSYTDNRKDNFNKYNSNILEKLFDDKYFVSNSNILKIIPESDINKEKIKINLKPVTHAESASNKYLNMDQMLNKSCYDNFKKQKTLGHHYEYMLNHKTGMCFEESMKIYNGKVQLDHLGLKLIYHLGEYKKR